MKYWFSFILFLAGITLSAQEVATVRAKLPMGMGERTLRVTVENGNAILQGDIDLGPFTPSPGGRGGADLIGSVPDLQNGGPWSNSTVPYEIAPSHPKRSLIIRAIDTMNARTNVRFVPKRASDRNYITFSIKPASDAGAASSRLGCLGGQQFIKVKDISMSYATILHEMMHALGIMHEQCRPDRDTYVSVDLTNVDPRALHNFDICDFVSTASPYDLNSIMHYSSDAFMIATDQDGITSIMVRPAYRSQLRGPLGQRVGFSPGDIATINRMYPTRGRRGGEGEDTGTATDSPGVRTDTPAARVDSTAADASSSASIDVRYTVQLIAQPTNMSCWAASIAMIYAWFRNIRVDPTEIRDGVGVWANFPQEWRTSGLLPNEPRVFQRFHFCCERPRQFTVDSMAYLLRTFGPLWVAASVNLGGGRPAAHVRVVTGMYGDGTPDGTSIMINDPWGEALPPNPTSSDMAGNRGRSYEVSFRTFLTQLNDLSERERREGYTNPIYVVHAPSLDVVECSCN